MDVATSRQQIVNRIDKALAASPRRVVLRHARKIDAGGVQDGFWLVAADGVILATGQGDDELATVCRTSGIDMEAGGPSREAAGVGTVVVDAKGAVVTPGYVDIHAHGAWGSSFDDGPEAIAVARAGHAVHGTTRQVLSLITNPVDVMADNLRTIHAICARRPDCLGAHLEGPFLALSRKGAHDPQALRDPTDALVDRLLEAADGSIRQITIAPELEHGIRAIGRFAQAGVVPAVGHSDADYETARRGFDAGARILTHVFNAMNGIHHRKPGPIPAALDDNRVRVELINDGFHVSNPAVRLAYALFAGRTMFITDAMAATDCPDGPYKLGALDVEVNNGHARLVSNGAIAGSTLTLDVAVRRAVSTLGFAAPKAVESATLNPARALGLDRPNAVTGAPIGLLAAGYAADFLVQDDGWHVHSVWCAGRQLA